jgi:ABC-type transport system involved in cytochrome bd biosynthesis fused ATPase/permease subunit
VRRSLGIIPQEFTSSAVAFENMKLLCPDLDDEKLRAACIVANAWEFIAKMPTEMDEMFGKGACRLSKVKNNACIVLVSKGRLFTTLPSTNIERAGLFSDLFEGNRF